MPCHFVKASYAIGINLLADVFICTTSFTKCSKRVTFSPLTFSIIWYNIYSVKIKKNLVVFYYIVINFISWALEGIHTDTKGTPIQGTYTHNQRNTIETNLVLMHEDI